MSDAGKPLEPPDTEAVDPQDERSRGAMLGKLLPELSMLLVLAGLWLDRLPAWAEVSPGETLPWLLAVEGATLMLMVTLVDIASRPPRRPPLWLGLLLAIGLLALYPEVIGLLAAGWELGMWVFLPLLWSVIERLRELWTLPTAPRLEKLRRRALSFGRLCSGIALAGAFILGLLGHAIVLGDVFDPDAFEERFLLPLLALFYLIAAFDTWRVHRPCFAARPRSLWPWFDQGETADIRPLG